MDFFIECMEKTSSYQELRTGIQEKKFPLMPYGLVDGAYEHLLASLAQDLDQAFLVLCPDVFSARKFYESIKHMGEESVYLLPYREYFYFTSLSSNQSDKGEGLEALKALLEGRCKVLVTSIENLQKKFMAPDRMKKASFSLEVGDDLDLEDLLARLVALGYERVDQVEGPGQFSNRGGIVDLFTYEKNPIRIEFFDTEVDSIRTFDVASQRSIASINRIDLVPYGEFIFKAGEKEAIVKRAKKDLEGENISDRSLEKFQPYFEEFLESNQVSNMDLLLPYLGKASYASILDYFQSPPLIFVKDLHQALQNLDQKAKKNLEDLTEMLQLGEVLKGHLSLVKTREDALKVLKGQDLVLLQGVISSLEGVRVKKKIPFDLKATVQYKGRMDLFLEEIQGHATKKTRVIIFGGDDNRCRDLVDYLTSNHLAVSYLEDRQQEAKDGIIITPGSLVSGYEYPKEGYVVYNHGEIYGQGKKKKKKSKKGKALNFEDLKIGDYVVHEAHGIGQYVGTKQLEIQGTIKDYIKISYRGGDNLFLPMDQLSIIHKFIGKEGQPPKINRLNSPEWNRTKLKARKAVEVMAEDLIQLYAKREEAKGFKFSKDDSWQREFEDAFEYEPTEGQLEAAKEIKRDMQSNRPMDRLLCADVGYGKTEVALRAAFKAILDDKQVAFLVPTTILAQQHYNTALKRFQDFPVDLTVLSRFRTANQQKQDLKKLKAGQLNLVIGTHRLLSKDVHFKDLGLLIVDEEQRFGVRHKEALRMLKENVDTLTLTATPIPRTLQMSMVGIRDMSVIEEPPQERFPVQTYVVEQNDYMVREAILKEIERGGQVYIVYNRVATMESKLRQLKDLVPEARFAIANGQMSESQLEDTMLDFVNGEVDVLLCSTIIETGMDVKNANTMIVYNSNHLGLSQLYQLRGRIGRSNRIAYCYLTYEKDVSMSQVAEKRLQAIKEFTEFGSGFKIALRDLEIRGSGSILGSKQSGHIDAIGYDLYVKYLKEAIAQLRGEAPQEKIETSIELNVDSYIEPSYIQDPSQRMEIYKKIAMVESEEDFEDLMDELIDRFGDPSKKLISLLRISWYRNVSGQYGIESISQKGQDIQINFAQGEKLDLAVVNELKQKYRDQVTFSLSGANYIHFKRVKDPLLLVEDSLKTLKKQKNFT